MLDDGVTSEVLVEQSLVLLAHPSVGVVERGEEGYRLVTSAANGMDVLRRFEGLVGGMEDETSRRPRPSRR